MSLDKRIQQQLDEMANRTRKQIRNKNKKHIWEDVECSVCKTATTVLTKRYGRQFCRQCYRKLTGKRVIV